MKLKDLMNKCTRPLIIFHGNYKKDIHYELIARLVWVKSDTEYYIEGVFKTPDEGVAVVNKISDCVDLRINKRYINTDGKLVVYVK